MSDENRSEPLYAIVRYRLKPEHIESSRPAAAELYAELAADGPGWLRQASFEVDDNGGVLTLVQLDRDPSALRALEPFQRRRAGLADRCQEPPTTTTVRLLGAYRLTLGPDDPA
jgi:hypothetical protein